MERGSDEGDTEGMKGRARLGNTQLERERERERTQVIVCLNLLHMCEGHSISYIIIMLPLEGSKEATKGSEKMSLCKFKVKITKGTLRSFCSR